MENYSSDAARLRSGLGTKVRLGPSASAAARLHQPVPVRAGASDSGSAFSQFFLLHALFGGQGEVSRPHGRRQSSSRNVDALLKHATQSPNGRSRRR